jgi:hypothetical protein
MMPGMNIPLMNMPHMMGHRPLFPAAAAVAQSTAIGQPKPTFPAYSNATISAPPTKLTNATTSASTSTANETQKPSTIQQNPGTASKIMHPPEDVSLEEIKARKSQYRINKSQAAVSQSQASITASIAASKAQESKLIAAAQEVSASSLSLFVSFFIQLSYFFCHEHLLEPDRCVVSIDEQ